MPPRFRSSILFAFVLLVLYLIFPFGRKEAIYENGDLLNGAGNGVGGEVKPGPEHEANPLPPVVHTKEGTKQTSLVGQRPHTIISTPGTSTTTSALAEATSIAPESDLKPQDEFNKEYDALGLDENAGKIYGNTLNTLEATGNHAGFAAAMLTPTESWTPYNNAPPLLYNPYPDYNQKVWNATNQGTYVACDGLEGEIRDVLVFSGHPLAFEKPAIGSYIPLDIDSNLCFERESRLAPYGYQEEGSTNTASRFKRGQKPTDWDSVNWGQLQEFCYQKNAARYTKVEDMPKVDGGANWANGTLDKVKSRTTEINGTIEDEAEARKQGLHGLPKTMIQPKSRTAVILRSYSGKNYTENDKQNIRSLVTELSLRSGGEYQVYLLVQMKGDHKLPIWTDAAVHEKAIHDNVPKEFWDMTILWDDTKMREWYPLIPKEVNNVNQSQWLSVQKFSQENPQFDFFWNWELDSRYTGHHYNLLEKLAGFAKAQPRKYLWERNERYYIPSFHGPYEGQFRHMVQRVSGHETVWGPPPVAGVTPIGSGPPVMDPNEGNYEWGVDEEADYISLAPIFDPINTSWPGRDDVWGYGGKEGTPRRASIGTQSRCSKKLLDTMHAENQKGNHVGSEMTPQTVALLHGFKAVYAPIPVFFDRAWSGEQLNRWFNPGPKGVSGSAEESPFSWGREGRFEGSTWYYRAVPPMRLYNNWMGWEDSGIGGVDWEKPHGRTCLPPMLLHPIKDIVKPPPGHFSKSELPYPARKS